MDARVRHALISVVAATALFNGTLVDPIAHARGEEPRPVRIDRPQFWRGESVVLSGPDSWDEAALLAHAGSRACGQGAPEVVCSSDFLDVGPVADGTELRVALEHPSAIEIPAPVGPTPSLEQFSLALVGPSNDEYASTGMVFPVAGNVVYTPEVRVKNPEPGVWEVRVIALRVRNPDYADRPTYRLRANLTPVLQPDPSETARDLLPNLQANAPFELIFAACVEDRDATRCLRFAQGPNNVGEGPLDLEVVPPPDELNLGGDPAGENIIRAPEYQFIHRSDGTIHREHVGSAGFHTAPDHMHYHHIATGAYELLAVDPETRTMRPAAPGNKVGFCMGDYLMGRWRSFEQAPQRTYSELLIPSSCAVPNAVTARFGLSAGWGDVYPAGSSGNYLDFGSNPDGYYVIRATTNPCQSDTAEAGCKGMILESDYSDNTAYTYFRVDGTDTPTPVITPIERGRGTGPFDPNRKESGDYRLFLHPPLDSSVSLTAQE